MNCPSNRQHPTQNLASVLFASAVCLSAIFAGAANAQVVIQPYYYGTPGGGFAAPASGAYPHGDCPSPEQSPPGQYTPAEDGAAVDGGADLGAFQELPEVVNFSGEVAYASAPQSAVPNAIGDSMGGCGRLLYDDGIGLGPDVELDICPAGGRKFKATHNNSPVPRSRFFHTYKHFDDALGGTLDGNRQLLNVDRHELGYEYAFCCGLASFQLNVPFSHTIESDLNQAVLQTLSRDMELGNVSVALKAMVYQDCYTTFSLGLGVDIPTAEDVTVQNANAFFAVENEAVTLSPFVGWLVELSPNLFTQGFVQCAIPVNKNEIHVNFFQQGTVDPSVDEVSLLYIDLSTGLWLYRDNCTGNGIAAIAELHYTTAVSRPDALEFASGGEVIEFAYLRRDILNATIGATLVGDRSDLTVAAVLPLTDRPDQFFDWELAVNLNRRF